MRKAWKRYADEFLRDPKEHDVRGSHTVHVSQAKEALVESEEQEGDTTALAALAQESDTDLEETDVQEILAGLQKIATVTVRAKGEPRFQARDRAHHWRETLSS